jgi:hypothetical protein
MTLMLSLSAKAEANLRQRAAAEGKDLTAYATEILERAAAKAALDETLEPVRADFAASGMSDDQIMDLGRRELESLRRERKANQP